MFFTSPFSGGLSTPRDNYYFLINTLGDNHPSKRPLNLSCINLGIITPKRRLLLLSRSPRGYFNPRSWSTSFLSLFPAVILVYLCAHIICEGTLIVYIKIRQQNYMKARGRFLKQNCLVQKVSLYVIFLKTFHRAGDYTTVDEHELPVPVYANYVRFRPTKVYTWNCMRVEVYGTESEFSHITYILLLLLLLLLSFE